MNEKTKWLLLGVSSLLVYGVIGWLSPQFELTNPGVNRPILLVIGLFTGAFLIYLVALFFAGLSESPFAIRFIIGFGLAFRMLLLFSQPIQEVDIYRYIWDGNVTVAGYDPFAHSPASILNPTSDAKIAIDMRARREICEGLDSVATKVHFPQLTTPYPPVSQAVFAFSALATPAQASEKTHLRIMKGTLLLFDCGVGLSLLLILRVTGKPLPLVVAYWWCPLVMKEIANSGHLDSIAVFFCTFSIYLILKSNQVDRRRCLYAGLSAICISLGIAAKLYPVVILPLWFLYVLKAHGRAVLPFTLLVILASSFMIWPMLRHTSVVQKHTLQFEQPPATGIEAFYHYWEINDLAFMSVVENLKPDETVAESDRAWFVVTPDSFRKDMTGRYAKLTGAAQNQSAFQITRILFLILFALAVAFLSFKFWREPSDQTWLRMAFLTIAWFWLLSPTQNPWYWIWALPLIPFVRNRVWYLLSGLVLLYYLRFWFNFHYPDVMVGTTSYRGQLFFDFVIPWIEFGPWFVLLLMSSLIKECFRKESNVLQ